MNLPNTLTLIRIFFAPLLLIAGKVALWVALISAFVSAIDYGRRFNLLPGARPGPPASAADTKPTSGRGRISA